MGKKGKFWRILRFNLLALLAVFLLAEAVSWCILSQELKYYIDHSCVKDAAYEKLRFPNYFYKIKSFENRYAYIAANGLRPVITPADADKKRPIVAFGCSYTCGSGLENSQTYPYRLAHIMGRKIFNRAAAGWGIQHMLYQLEKEDELQDIENPEFVLYLYITDHLRRVKPYFGQMFGPRAGSIFEGIYPLYAEKGGRLVMKKARFPWLTRSTLIGRLIERQLLQDTYGPNLAERYERSRLAKMHFQQSYEAVKKKWPNAKFVLLMWPDWILSHLYIEELEDNKDLHIVWLQDLLEPHAAPLYERQYMQEKDLDHPNEQTWDLLTPLIAKKLEEISNNY